MRQEYDTRCEDTRDRITVEQIRSAMNVWLDAADLPRRARRDRFEQEREKQHYYQRRNEQTRDSHTKTRIERLHALGIDVDKIKSCLPDTRPPCWATNHRMKITCPSCSTQIPSNQLNAETDIALCSQCNEAFSISALVASGQDSGEFELSESPHGAWFSETFTGWTIGATTRSPFSLYPSCACGLGSRSVAFTERRSSTESSILYCHCLAFLL